MSKKKPKNGHGHEPMVPVKNHFELRKIKPITTNQELMFRYYEEGHHLMVHGAAGTGKTFCGLYLALDQILNQKSVFDKIVIIRSATQSKDVGFMPGNLKEKIQLYEEPYREICDSLFGRGDGYDILKTKGLIHFASTSFLRGITFRNSIVILDEAQNLEGHEVNTVMTRIGDNSRIIVCGDFRQTDLVKRHEKEGMTTLMKITDEINSFAHIEFETQDIVRSGIVKQYLIAKEKLGL